MIMQQTFSPRRHLSSDSPPPQALSVCFTTPTHHTASATSTYVTEAAKEAVASDFPNATNVDWRDGQAPDVYTAYFTVNSAKILTNVDKGQATLLSILRYTMTRPGFPTGCATC